MKYSTFLYITICTITAIFFPYIAFAKSTVNISNNGEGSKTNVNIQTNTGNNTICQNGKCTTTSNSENGKSTVCINGKCTSSEDGNLDIQSEDGNSSVHINNSGATNSPTSSNSSSTENNTTINTTVKVDTDTSVKKASNASEKQKNEVKQKITDQPNALQKIIDDIKNFFKNFHLF
jgi:hypothetical protein